ncbi:cytochrome C [Dissulfurirhabdus thermomarina]|uniref:Cytochrome C n=1 Tax=Dissulfurirhabdus thermomarina TaxID=1765737 RepID=A0A6N9TK03_DISTH|nr:cytochrome c3 family protein [Dissulfurirhabdus thermomarina]NDY41409.1 cytochrome C [Dissulfurirhabdus thermomarina]NMX24397.1 cytochrome C [Dissulfurirhabdus thermomarina]
MPRPPLRAAAAFAAAFLCALPGPGPAAAACVTGDCHAGLTRHRVLHPPAAEGECTACHEPTGAPHPGTGPPGFRTAGEGGAALCARCHEKRGTGKNVHDPVAAGDCTACHDPHGAETEGLVRAGPGGAPVCLDCHEAEAFTRAAVHGPVAAGDCTACHDPHESPEPALLRRKGPALCFGCHSDFAAALARAPVRHTALDRRGCTACHDPHSAAQGHLLRRPMPGLCFECHPAMERTYRSAAVKHKPLYREESCGTCHGAHYADAPGLLPEKELELCLGCHGKDDETRSHPLRNIRKEIKGKRHLHGPLAEGRCSPCHEPHGSDNFRLLTGPYPAAFYAPYADGTYGFCLRCHERNLLRFAETTLYTRFRDGKRNLHVRHTASGRKGRTCRACHAPHAADAPHLLADEGAPFGGWRIPLRFTPLPDGGRCAPGCHRPLSYSRSGKGAAGTGRGNTP